MLRAGWFFGACERLTAEQLAQMNKAQQQFYIWGHTVIVAVENRRAEILNAMVER
jgi:hypothetical protein